MAWRTPKTDRGSASTRTTAEDINRIAGNINFLKSTSIKETWTAAEIVDGNTWRAIIAATTMMAAEMEEEPPTIYTDYENLNYIEALALQYKNYDPLYPNNGLYPAEGLWPR